MKGKALMLGVEIDSQFHTVAYATGHTFETSAQTGEITTKDHPGDCADFEVTGFSWSISTDNLVEDSKTAVACGYNVMMKAAKNKLPVNVSLSYFEDAENGETIESTNYVDWFEKGSPVAVITGKAVITSIELNAPNKQNATFRATLTGKGAFTIG